MRSLAGYKIEKWRKAQKPHPWSRQKLADVVGVHRQRIYNIERNGQRPLRNAQLVQQFDALDICRPADWFAPAPADAEAQSDAG